MRNPLSRPTQQNARKQTGDRMLPDQMRLVRTLAWVSASLAAIAVIAFAVTRGISQTPRAAPALPKQRLAGPRVSIASLRGKPSLVLFWASWCGQCGAEAQAVRSFAASPAGAGRIVGVDWADKRRAAKAFIARHHWSFSNVMDATSEVGLSYGVTQLPALFVIDAHGRIFKALSGTQTQSSLERALRSA
jgi:peroxiredoxin